MQVEIRRASGGLRLFVQPLAAPRWSARLPYPRAGELIDAIRGSQTCAAPEFSFVPDSGTGEATLECGASSDHLCAEDVHALCDGLRAHMPDRMRPLPG